MSDKPTNVFPKLAALLWPIGGTMLGLVVVPVAIAEYPDFFNDNQWVLPVSVAFVVACWFVPLLVHNRAIRLYRWVADLGGGGKAVTAVTIVLACASLYVGFSRLLRFHQDHLHRVLAERTGATSPNEGYCYLDFLIEIVNGSTVAYTANPTRIPVDDVEMDVQELPFNIVKNAKPATLLWEGKIAPDAGTCRAGEYGLTSQRVPIRDQDNLTFYVFIRTRFTAFRETLDLKRASPTQFRTHLELYKGADRVPFVTRDSALPIDPH